MSDPVIKIGGRVPVYRVGDELRWTAGLAIDFDGAPTAYHPDDHPGLDALANAGHPGHWYGLATNNGKPDGAPVVQGGGDPAPGFFVSTTALSDHTRHATDPRAYVDATTVPYVSIPPEIVHLGARVGDVCLVEYQGRTCAAIVADVGPADRVGEGSPALAKALGIDAGRHGGVRDGVSVRLFLRSRATPAWPREAGDVERQVAGLTAPVPREALS